MMTSSNELYKKDCLAVIRTPLQLINASEYIYEHGITNAVLVIIRNSRKWDFSAFEAIPSIALWSKVVEFRWSGNVLNRSGAYPPLRIFGNVIDDFRFRRFFSQAEKEWKGGGTIIIGNTNDLWLRHIANSLKNSSKLVECEDGAASLNSSWLPSKSWLLRKNLLHFNAESPRLNEIYTSYDGIEAPGVVVTKNNYSYIASLFDQGKVQTGEDVWFVGQPLIELGLMSRDAYLKSVLAVKRNCAGGGRFLYCPHPSEKADNVDYLCDFLDVDRVRQKTILEITILSADKVPARIASLYSSAISTVLGIFNGRIGVDVYRPDAALFTGKMANNTYKEVYSWFEVRINPPNGFYRIERDSYSIY